MNKYKVIYYLSIVVFIVNLLAMIGSLFGWFTIVESKYLFWINIVLLLVFRWVERKIKFKRDRKRRKVMKEFLAGFQVDTENKALAGVCAGLGNYFNIQANIVRLVTVLLFLSSTEVGIITVTLYAYLAGWLGNEPLGGWSKKS